MSPFICWDEALHGENEIVRWAATASAIPCTGEVGRNVVDTLLQVACVDSLRPRIPIEIWGWLEKRPSLPEEMEILTREDFGITGIGTQRHWESSSGGCITF